MIFSPPSRISLRPRPECGDNLDSKLKGTCTWVVFKDSNPIVQTRNIVKYPNVFFTREDGRSALRHDIISEFIKYGFPKLGIVNVEAQKRIVWDLRYLAKGITAKTVDSAKARKKVKFETDSNSQTDNEDTVSDSSSGSFKINTSEVEHGLLSDSNDSGENY